jgi:ornithine lipid hydroxylase
MTSVFAVYALLEQQGVPLIVSTYMPILFAAGSVAMLERAFTHHTAWRPAAREIRTDLVFITTIQLVLPPFVSFLFVYLLVEPARALDLPTAHLWPHTWPIWTQAVLMVLTVDFMRYWLHRAAHRYDALWRLHSVHHSVEQLYWLNTARFHPLEKIAQMCLDSLPFLLMGVDARVLGLYAVAYSSNGFFQHCNIELRYGPLNYIVGSAETHRWHHSRVPRESNANYGSTVIVWDLLFGTWLLPKDRAIADLGLQEPDYPKTFFGLMRAPFRRS